MKPEPCEKNVHKLLTRIAGYCASSTKRSDHSKKSFSNWCIFFRRGMIKGDKKDLKKSEAWAYSTIRVKWANFKTFFAKQLTGKVFNFFSSFFLDFWSFWFKKEAKLLKKKQVLLELVQLKLCYCKFLCHKKLF